MWALTKFVLAGAIALALFQNSASSAGKSANANSAPVAASSAADPSHPVITVRGVCEPGKAGNGKDATSTTSCTTIVTREEFETLVTALRPNGQDFPANARRQLAKTYAEYMAVEAAARKAGMEDTPQFRELMNWVRLRTVTDFYRSKLQEKYRTPPQEEIDAYYEQHSADYEKVDLIRILVPRENGSVPNKDEFDKKARNAAETARESLAKGLDPIQIQKDTYAALGLAAPPHPALGERRRADLIPDEATEVFSLKLGGVSRVETEPTNYVVYKVVGNSMQPKEQVKNDIVRTIVQQKFKDAMKAVLDAAPAEFDEQYLEHGGAANESKPPAPSSPPSH